MIRTDQLKTQEYEPVLPTTEEHTAAELTETMKPEKTDSCVCDLQNKYFFVFLCSMYIIALVQFL